MRQREHLDEATVAYWVTFSGARARASGLRKHHELGGQLTRYERRTTDASPTLLFSAA